jgi:hypothetical protein
MREREEGERGMSRTTYLKFAGAVQSELCLFGLKGNGVTDNHAVATVAIAR